jgi:4-hydroxybutyrate dehydrogenase
MISRFSFPTNVVFGPGSVREVGGLAKGLGAKRALIVTDAGVSGAGLVSPVQESLTQAGVNCAVFEGVEPNPTEGNIEVGVEAFRDDGCDIVIAVGGGSALDGGKAVKLRVTHTGPFEQYDDNIGGDRLIRRDMPPLIAVPTTAGTGSEVGRSTVIICRATDRKTVFFSPYLMPDYAVCDPEITVTLPARITAATGMDALTHCVEAYLAKPYHPMADAIALGGIRLCGKSLRRAVEDGRDLEARTDMMMAAMMGATAFQKGLGVVHSLAHPLSSVAGMHHGTANAVLLPPVLEFNAVVVPERLADIATVLELRREPQEVIDWVRDLNRAIGIAGHLREYGVAEGLIPSMVEKAMQDGCHVNNPRACTADDMRRLYEAAL